MRQLNIIERKNIINIVKVGTILIVVTVLGVFILSNIGTEPAVLNKTIQKAMINGKISLYNGINTLKYSLPFVKEVIVEGAKFY